MTRKKENRQRQSRQKRIVKETKDTIVISLGGSLICPSDKAGEKKIDTQFLRTFVSLIKTQLSKERQKRIIIITGGGAYCRAYNAAFNKITLQKKTARRTVAEDYIGIAMTKVNAKLVQCLLAAANIPIVPALLNDPTRRIEWKRARVAVGAGYLPGHSTDYDAVLAAIANKGSAIINLTNIDYVYTHDPRKDEGKHKRKDAQPLKNLTWKEYKKVLEIKKWSSGLHTPFDPLASALAEKKKLTVFIVNGQKKRNLASALASSEPSGTRIHSSD